MHTQGCDLPKVWKGGPKGSHHKKRALTGAGDGAVGDEAQRSRHEQRDRVQRSRLQERINLNTLVNIPPLF